MDIFELKITLRHTDPPVWRRVRVPADVPLDELHDVIQIAMGWDDEHLHAFRTGDVEYGIVDPDFPRDTRDEAEYSLNQVVAKKGAILLYEYDFGDGWVHEIKVEKIRPAEPGEAYCWCTAGERACPPEDCGGPPGYARILEAFRNPKDEEHEEIVEWLGEEFDPETFDLDEVNEILNA